jgi:hypothetical protein
MISTVIITVIMVCNVAVIAIVTIIMDGILLFLGPLILMANFGNFGSRGGVRGSDRGGLLLFVILTSQRNRNYNK